MPAGHEPPTHPAHLHNELRRALRHGARAARLLRHVPELVDMLAPPDGKDARATQYERAYQAEQSIRAGIAEIGGEAATVLQIIYGLTRNGYRPLDERRKAAAQYLGIQPDTFRRAHHEGQLILDLTMEIYARLKEKAAVPPDTAA